MLSDLEYMNRALDLAERGQRNDQPESDGRRGCRARRRHDRRAGVSRARRRGRTPKCARSTRPATLARGASLYCTLEPCSHVGRTGPCVERIAAAGIARVVAAISRPRSPREWPRVRISCVKRASTCRSAPVASVRSGLNRPYFTFKTKQRPFVIMKAATSLDNRVAARPGERTRITSEDSLRHAHAVRAEVDAIAVGSGTVLADDPLLTAREVHRRRPLARVLFDRRLRIARRRGCSRRSTQDR